MKRPRILLAALLILAVPSVARANAGTPLMMATIAHMLIGNLLIGIVEGILLAKVFGLSLGKCIGGLILANYFSAWLGGWFVTGFVADALPMGLDHAWSLLWLLVVATYLLTLLLEFPFVALLLRRERPWLGEAFTSPWTFRSGFWPGAGLSGKHADSGEQVWIGLDTPFLSWPVRNATHLPTDNVLFQLGWDQICVYDPVKKQIALLAQGGVPSRSWQGTSRRSPPREVRMRRLDEVAGVVLTRLPG